MVYSDAEFALQGATMFGISANSSTITQAVNFNCPSGECSFPFTTTLAVCSRCENVTSQLEKNQNSNGDLYFDLIRDRSFAKIERFSTEYRLPNGLFLNNFNDSGSEAKAMVFMSMLGTTDPRKTVSMGDIDTLIWAQSLIKVDGAEYNKTWLAYNVRAEECGLYYCVKKYSSEVHNATLFETSSVLQDEKRIPESWALDRTRWPNVSEAVVESVAFHPIESAIQRTDLQLGHPGSDAAWNISQQAVDGISAFMQKTFAVCVAGANCTTEILDSWGPVNGYLIARYGAAGGEMAEEYEPSVAKAIWSTNDINQTFSNIALSMTNAIRNGGDNSSSATGSLGIFEAIYIVDWRWIALHCFVVVGTLVFLFATIYTTLNEGGGKIPAWKGSELAVFSRGHVVGDYLGDATTIDELQEKAKNISVVLVDPHQDRPPQGQDHQGAPFLNEPSKQGVWTMQVEPESSSERI